MRSYFGLLSIAGGLLLMGCATTPPPGKDFTAFEAARPRSILIAPVVNHSTETEAADLFLTTLPILLGERGYYVFPTHMSKRLMEDDGLADPMLVHGTASPQVAGLFGADAVLYVEVLEWKSTYAVVSSGIEVKFLYTLKDGRTNNLLWQEERQAVYSQTPNSGNIFADIIATAVVAALNNARSDYTPVAMVANQAAITIDGQGLPYGPYSPLATQNEVKFPSSGSGVLSNSTISAISYPVEGKSFAGKQAEQADPKGK
jgi:hypothetical protein